MGEAPAFFADDLQIDGIELRSQGSKTATTLGDKIYMIAGADDFGVQIFNKCTGEWVTPIVLGTKPMPCKSHSALILNEDGFLVIKGDTSLEDGIWFLETDTKFVREQKKKLETEVIAWSKGVEGEVGIPIVISGPSGVGKGTLISKLMNEYPSMFGFSVSHTTRSARNKEKDGVHYHFTERTVMEKEISDGKFLEFASVHGNLYGTSVEAVEVVADAGKRCILDIDVQGARSVRASHLEAIFIFICPPSFEELEKRLRERGTETEEQIQKRLRNALAELEQGQSPGLFDHLLVNDDLENCYSSLKKLLGLDGNVDTSPKSSPKLPNLPLGHSVSKIGQDIVMGWGTEESQMAGNHWYVLDTSSRKGGAPGRTRGLKISAINPIAYGLNRIKKLS